MRQKPTFELDLKKGNDYKSKAQGSAEEILADLPELSETGDYRLWDADMKLVIQGDRAAIEAFLNAEIVKAPTAEELLVEAQDELVVKTSELEQMRSQLETNDEKLRVAANSVNAAHVAKEKAEATAAEAMRGHDLMAKRIEEIARENGEISSDLKAMTEDFEHVSETARQTEENLIEAHNRFLSVRDETAALKTRFANVLGTLGYLDSAIDHAEIGEDVGMTVTRTKNLRTIIGAIGGAAIIGLIWFFSSFDGCSGKPNQPPTLSVTPTETSAKVGETVTLTYSVTDPDDKKHEVSVVADPSYGKVTKIDTKAHTVTYVGESPGADSFRLIADDKQAISPGVTVYVDVKEATTVTPPSGGGGGTTPPTTEKGGNPFGEIPTTSGTR